MNYHLFEDLHMRFPKNKDLMTNMISSTASIFMHDNVDIKILPTYNVDACVEFTLLALVHHPQVLL